MSSGITNIIVFSNVGHWHPKGFGVSTVVNSQRQFINYVVEHQAGFGHEVTAPLIIKLDTIEAYNQFIKKYKFKALLDNTLEMEAIVVETNQGDHVYVAAYIKPFVRANQ